MDIQEKYNALLDNLKNYKKVAIAFSGGVDSSFLAYAAKQVLPDKLIAITVKSPYIPEREINEAVEFAKKYEIAHELIETDIIEDIKENPENRCYLCKKHFFTVLRKKAQNMGIKTIIEGSNADDPNDIRPGMKALKELNIASPLLACGFSKTDIRNISRKLRIPTWEKPAYACLLTRLPFGCKIQDTMLRRIENAEVFMAKKGYSGSRVRVHHDLARIEINPVYFDKLNNEYERGEIINHFKSLGFTYITLDLEGYKIGSFNTQINNT